MQYDYFAINFANFVGNGLVGIGYLTALCSNIRKKNPTRTSSDVPVFSTISNLNMHSTPM